MYLSESNNIEYNMDNVGMNTLSSIIELWGEML